MTHYQKQEVEFHYCSVPKRMGLGEFYIYRLNRKLLIGKNKKPDKKAPVIDIATKQVVPDPEAGSLF